MQVNAVWVHAGVCQINFSAQTLFDVFAKFHFQQLPKVTLTHIPLHSNLAATIWDHNFLFAVTLHRWLHLVAQVYLKLHAVTYVIYYI